MRHAATVRADLGMCGIKKCRNVWLMPAAGVRCSNATNIGEYKTWTQSEYCTGQNSVRGKSPQKCSSPGDGQTSVSYTHLTLPTIYSV